MNAKAEVPAWAVNLIFHYPGRHFGFGTTNFTGLAVA